MLAMSHPYPNNNNTNNTFCNYYPDSFQTQLNNTNGQPPKQYQLDFAPTYAQPSNSSISGPLSNSEYASQTNININNLYNSNHYYNNTDVIYPNAAPVQMPNYYYNDQASIREYKQQQVIENDVLYNMERYSSLPNLATGNPSRPHTNNVFGKANNQIEAANHSPIQKPDLYFEESVYYNMNSQLNSKKINNIPNTTINSTMNNFTNMNNNSNNNINNIKNNINNTNNLTINMSKVNTMNNNLCQLNNNNSPPREKSHVESNKMYKTNDNHNINQMINQIKNSNNNNKNSQPNINAPINVPSINLNANNTLNSLNSSLNDTLNSILHNSNNNINPAQQFNTNPTKPSPFSHFVIKRQTNYFPASPKIVKEMCEYENSENSDNNYDKEGDSEEEISQVNSSEISTDSKLSDKEKMKTSLKKFKFNGKYNYSIISSHENKEQLYDITEYLNLPQSIAAKKLQIPASTLSKRWRESTNNRKWPWRTVKKIDKEIVALLQNVSNKMASEVEASVVVLLKKREEELKTAIIRL